ncbi:MAG: O-antigen ligase family protein [Sulfitobacter litoralis]|nr:O-antigen ligase family protein [Sulfitobacter litoralis]
MPVRCCVAKRRLMGRSTPVSMVVLIYMLLLLLPAGFSIGSVYLTGTRILLACVIVPLAVRLFCGHFGRIQLTDILFLLHFLWVGLSLMINNPEQATENAGSVGVEFLGGYLIGRAYVRDRHSFAALIKILTTLIVLCFPLAVIEAQNGTSVPIQLWQMTGLSTPPDLSIDRRMGLERVQLAFEHPIHWGLFCTIATSLYFVGLARQHSFGLRLMILAVICASCFLSLSSGALLAALVQIGLILWGFLCRRLAQKWIVLSVGVAALYILVDLISNRAPIQVFMSYATFSAQSAYWRSAIFQWGMVNIWSAPVTGIGLHDWLKPIWMHTTSIDNFWLFIAMRFGLPAFAFLTVGYGLALWRVGRINFQEDPTLRQMRRGWVLCFVGLSLSLSTVHIWGAIYGFVFFVFGAGLWMLDETPSSPHE